MNKATLTSTRCQILSLLAVLGLSLSPARADEGAKPNAKAASDKVVLFNGKDKAGWKTRDEKATANWKVAGEAKLDEKGKLVGTGEPSASSGVLVLEKPVHGADIVSEQKFGDGEFHVEVMIPKGSNSGVYLMGQYEVQVLDSFKKEKIAPGDMGGIYNTKAPSENAAKAPGEWQELHIVFRAPRFGPDGKKTENAKFVKVELNGKTIHENVEAPKATGSELPGGEKPTGPLMFQGDHGPVAFRNVWVKSAETK